MDDWFSSRGDEDDAWDETLIPGDDDYGDLLGPARNDSGSDTRPAGFAIGRASEDVLHTTAGQALDQRRRRSGIEPTPWQPGQSQEVTSTSYHKNFDLDVDGYFDVEQTKTSTRKRQRWFRAAVANARKRMEVSYKGLNPQDQEAMRKAIEAEWVSFFDSGAAKTIKLIHVPSGNPVIRARLVLTLKDIVEIGIVIGKRPKARLVVLGFEDMRALSKGLSSDSPTVTRLGSRVVMQIALSLGWRIMSGDISVAFLRGDPITRTALLRDT